MTALEPPKEVQLVSATEDALKISWAALDQAKSYLVSVHEENEERGYREFLNIEHNSHTNTHNKGFMYYKFRRES